MQTDDLVAWLNAQVDEDQRLARDAMQATASGADPQGAGAWAASDAPEGGIYVEPEARAILLGSFEYLDPELAAFVVSWQPQRVLADCEAKRQVIELHKRGHNAGCAVCDGDDYVSSTPVYPCATLRIYGAMYAKLGRPGYQESWRPE